MVDTSQSKLEFTCCKSNLGTGEFECSTADRKYAALAKGQQKKRAGQEKQRIRNASAANQRNVWAPFRSHNFLDLGQNLCRTGNTFLDAIVH